MSKGLRKDGRGKNHNIIIPFPFMQSIEIEILFLTIIRLLLQLIVSIPILLLLGLVHCPEQAIENDVISDLQSCLEFAKHRQANTTISVSSYDILTSNLSDADVVFKAGWNGLSSTGGGTLTGNNNWQQLMRDLKTIYHCTISQAEKSNIICLIVNVCRNQNPPGRFLLQDDTSGRWNEIGDDEAENRTKLALYELSNDEYAVKDTSSSSSATSASPVKVKEILRHNEDMVRETEAMELLDLLKDENDVSVLMRVFYLFLKICFLISYASAITTLLGFNPSYSAKEEAEARQQEGERAFAGQTREAKSSSFFKKDTTSIAAVCATIIL